MNPEVLGLILAGGQGRRLGGRDKALVDLGGRPLLAHVLERLRPQVGTVILNAAGDPARFDGYGLEVVADPLPGFQGPLAGILAGLRAAERRGLPLVASVAVDTPFFPPDLVARLVEAARLAGTPLACAASGGRTHPVFGLWPVALIEELQQSLIEQQVRKIDRWTAAHGVVVVEFAISPGDPFLNINTDEDRAQALALLPVVKVT